MLVSKFNLNQAEEEEEQRPEQTALEAAAEEEQYLDVEVFEERKLKKSEVSIRLSMLGKTAEGDGYTYLKASCTGLMLTEISAIKCFIHLQFVDFSENYLDLEALQAVTELPFIVLVHADKNKLTSAALKKAKYLQVIILNHNKLTSVRDVFQPELCTLEVGFNQIEEIAFDNRMSNLKCLDFRHNNIQDIVNIDFPNLDSLYLAFNKIHNLIGLEKLVNLRVLHVRSNPIRFLNGFSEELKKLQYINLRSCKVGTLRQIKKLRSLTGLETLVLKGCPYMGGTGGEDPDAADEEEDPELRVEVLAALPRLKRFNKGVYSPEERREAKDLMMQWLEEGEKDEEEEVVEEEQLEEQNHEEDAP